MPGMNDAEQAEESQWANFLRREDIKSFIIKTDEKIKFDVVGIVGEIKLIEVETRMYGWGGCGNNIGTCALVHVNFQTKDGTQDMDLQLGPAPRLTIIGPLAFAFGNGDPDTKTAEVCVGAKPDGDVDTIALKHGKI